MTGAGPGMPSLAPSPLASPEIGISPTDGRSDVGVLFTTNPKIEGGYSWLLHLEKYSFVCVCHCSFQKGDGNSFW